MRTYSPYNYTFNNPIRFVDADGTVPQPGGPPKVRVYTESGVIGHTFLTVGSGKSTTVYTYGRYGAVNGSLGNSGQQEKGFLRSAGTSGDGVLIRLDGKDAQNFINNAVNKDGAKAFEVSNVDPAKVKATLDKQFENGKELPSRGTKVDEIAKDDKRVVDTYELDSNNCTTKTSEAVRAGGNADFGKESVTIAAPDFGVRTEKVDIISPTGLQKDLLYESTVKGSGVKEVTDIVKKELR